MVYKEGGAPAVFQSPKCPRWTLPTQEDLRRRTTNCQSAMIKGRRSHQEDRTVCALDIRIPFPGLHSSLFPFFFPSQLHKWPSCCRKKKKRSYQRNPLLIYCFFLNQLHTWPHCLRENEVLEKPTSNLLLFFFFNSIDCINAVNLSQKPTSDLLFFFLFLNQLHKWPSCFRQNELITETHL